VYDTSGSAASCSALHVTTRLPHLRAHGKFHGIRSSDIQYNNCTDHPSNPFAKFSADVARTIGERRPKRIVVDLRHNGGGNLRVIAPLVAVLKSQRRTPVSSGFMAARDLKRQAHAVLVGEFAARGDPPSYPLDHAIDMTSGDLQAGRDPIMDWIPRQ
jgi:hypothetical protein